MRFYIALALVLTAPTVASAAEYNFVIDPARSFMSISLETEAGVQFSSAQTPGSDTTPLSGTLKVDLGGGTIEFLPTANVQFALQSEPQAPLADGTAGTSPAQFGLNVALAGIGDGLVAARDYVGDAMSGPISLVGSSYDATGVMLDLPSGITSYNLNLLGVPVIGSVATNNPAFTELAGGSLTEAGGLYTLTLPILIHGSTSVSGIDVVTVYDGQIVATALVPEPSSIALVAAGMFALALLRRRV